MHEKLKWTLEVASSEFDINPRTLSKRMKQGGIEPAFEDRRFSTHQICAAVFGDMDGERLRLVKAQADQAELDLAKARSVVVEADQVLRVFEDIAVAIRQVIKNSGLSDVEKQECLRQIRELNVEDFTREQQAIEEAV